MLRGRKDSIACFAIAAIVAFALDMLTKTFIFRWVEAEGGEVVLIPNYLSFLARLNQRALFSLGPEDGGLANLFLSIVATGAVVLIPIWALVTLGPKQKLLGVVLGAILGGAAGNLHDRILFGGVRDFIDAYYHDVYHWPTFNLADSFLVCGAIFLVITSMFTKDPETAPATVGAKSTSAS